MKIPIVLALLLSAGMSIAQSSSDYAQTALGAHNIHRANHSASALTWNPLQAYIASFIASSCVFEHQPFVPFPFLCFPIQLIPFSQLHRWRQLRSKHSSFWNFFIPKFPLPFRGGCPRCHRPMVQLRASKVPTLVLRRSNAANGGF